jgi:hypothetical protein
MIPRLAPVALVVLLLAGTAFAGVISCTGSFTYDDDAQLLTFNLAASGSVTIQTWSFGGGVNAAGQTIPAGGFAPVLTLIYPDDSIYSDDGSHGCGACNPDPVFGPLPTLTSACS